MKKVIFALAATASMAMVDNNIVFYGRTSNGSNQIGMEFISEHTHRLGTHEWKFGGVYAIGADFTSNDVTPVLKLGGRAEFSKNQAFVSSVVITGQSDCYGSIVTISGAEYAYQRKLEVEGNNWIEVSATIEDKGYGLGPEVHYAVGLKKFCYSYE